MTRKKGHRDSGTPGGSQRQLRVGELVRHAMADMLTRGDVHDPVIQGHLITVPEVQMTADLRLATIYIMPLAGRDAEEVVAAFERHKKFLRGEIAHRSQAEFMARTLHPPAAEKGRAKSRYPKVKLVSRPESP